ncbi:MAG: class I SAM-dependent methyltransferase [Proteobacteria bacterium]|nr:class I SAM-dependent methyltransferase [Pseudomonadota bacterium]
MSRQFSAAHDPKPLIDPTSVQDFFEERARKAEALGPVRAVIYQDKNPTLAQQRDAAEKALLFPLIDIRPDDAVLDAGCGSGRWAEVLIPVCGRYHGVDASWGLVDIARQRFGHCSHARFDVVSVDRLAGSPSLAGERFTRIISFGVYIYLNDDAVESALQQLCAVAAPEAKVVLREPVATGDRLTLSDFYSDDMEQSYSAVYRPEAELMGMFDRTLGAAGFRLQACGDVFDAGLNNRAETRQRWFAWVRGR